MNEEYFRLNGVDVGVAVAIDVSVRCGQVRIWLCTPPIRMTRELHNGMLTHAWKPIEDCFLRGGFSFRFFQNIALRNARYGLSLNFKTQQDNAGTLHIYDGQSCPNFFGNIRIDDGWLQVAGVISYEDAPPDVVDGHAMPIQIRKRFDPLPLIPARTVLTRAQALKRPATDVYALRIDANPALRAFPLEVLNFKHLEALEITCRTSGVRSTCPNRWLTSPLCTRLRYEVLRLISARCHRTLASYRGSKISR